MAVATGMVIAGVADIASNVLSGSAAKKAAQQKAQAAMQAGGTVQAAEKPYAEAGKQALGQLQGITAGGGPQFTMDQAQNMPAYEFALQQGQRALENSAAARGGVLGTNATQDQMKFAEGLASQTENEAFNQWLNQQKLEIGTLGNLTSLGQGAATTGAEAMAAGIQGAGAATAAGTQAQGNMWANIIGDVGSMAGNFATGGGFGNPLGGSNVPSNMAATDPNYGGTGFSWDQSTGIDPKGFLGGKTAGDYSDERLKSDVVRIGYTDGGLPIYRYRMGGRQQMGVMAQDVEQVNPSAVNKDRLGYRMVDYGQVR